MKKLHIIFLLLIITCLFSFTTAFADEIVDTEDESIFSVTIPMSMPIFKDIDGNIMVAEDLIIANNSTMAVEVSNVQVNVVNDWAIETYGTDFSTEASYVKKFTMQINNKSVNTDGSVVLDDTNWKPIASGENMVLSYDVDIARTEGIDEQIATVVFTVIPEGYTTEEPDPEPEPEPEPEEPTYVVKDLTDEDEEIGLWVYTINSSSNTATVTDYLGEYGENVDLVVPTSFNGATTTAINFISDTWANRTLHSLTIPRGVSLNVTNDKYLFSNLTANTVIIEGDCSLGWKVFSGANVDTFKIGQNVTFWTGYKYSSLISATINTLEIDSDIPENTIYDSIVNNLILGENCKNVGNNAFRYVTNISYLKGLENLETIGSYAFYNCFSEDFYFDNWTIKNATVSTYAFSELHGNVLNISGAKINNSFCSDASAFETVNIDNSSLGRYFINSKTGTITNLNIGENVTYTMDTFSYSSSSCVTITNITTVIDIPAYAFNYCDVRTVTTKEGCTSIGSSAFFNCENVESIILSEGLITINAESFFNSRFITELVIPSTCTYIGKNAFHETIALKSLSIAKDANLSIDEDAFYNASDLISFTINDNATVSIAKEAFLNCTDLTTFTIKKNCTVDIGEYGFTNCPNLSKIAIGDGSTVTFGNYSFQSGSKLSSFIMGKKPTITFKQYSFQNCTALPTLNFPDDSNVTIESEAFSECLNLSEITVGNNSTFTAGQQAFKNCVKLKKLIIGEGCTSYIGSSTFAQCSNLTDVIIEDAVSYEIDDSAFRYCSSLKTLSLGEGLTTIDDYAFQNCSALSGIVVIPYSCTLIDYMAFWNCPNVTEFWVPKNWANVFGSSKVVDRATAEAELEQSLTTAEELEEESEEEIKEETDEQEENTENTDGDVSAGEEATDTSETPNGDESSENPNEGIEVPEDTVPDNSESSDNIEEPETNEDETTSDEEINNTEESENIEDIDNNEDTDSTDETLSEDNETEEVNSNDETTGTEVDEVLNDETSVSDEVNANDEGAASDEIAESNDVTFTNDATSSKDSLNFESISGNEATISNTNTSTETTAKKEHNLGEVSEDTSSSTEASQGSSEE